MIVKYPNTWSLLWSPYMTFPGTKVNFTALFSKMFSTTYFFRKELRSVNNSDWRYYSNTKVTTFPQMREYFKNQSAKNKVKWKLTESTLTVSTVTPTAVVAAVESTSMAVSASTSSGSAYTTLFFFISEVKCGKAFSFRLSVHGIRIRVGSNFNRVSVFVLVSGSRFRKKIRVE
jgi:hypothetical protein